MSTTTFKGIELFAAGNWNGDDYTRDDLAEMVKASHEVGFTPPVKLGHMTDPDTNSLLKHEGLPAFGWIKNLRVVGQKLLGDLCDVPRRIADLIRAGAYKRLSAEIIWNFAQGGRTWPRVLRAVALLGSELPAVTTLRELESLYHWRGGRDEGFRLTLKYGAHAQKETNVMQPLRYTQLDPDAQRAVDRAARPETPADEVDRKTRAYAAAHNTTYEVAYHAVLRADENLRIRYADFGDIFVPKRV